jgi:hypothetical protein
MSVKIFDTSKDARHLTSAFPRSSQQTARWDYWGITAPPEHPIAQPSQIALDC